MFSRNNTSVSSDVDDLFDEEEVESQYTTPVAPPNGSQTPPPKQPRAAREFPRRPVAQTAQTTPVNPTSPKQSSESAVPQAQSALPGVAVGLIPPASVTGVLMLSTIVKTIAGTTAAPAAIPLIYAGSPLIAPWVGMAIIGLCYKQKWNRAKTITIAVMLGWGLSLPFAPVFLLPLATSIPSLNSLKSQSNPNLASPTKSPQSVSPNNQL